MIPSLRDAWSDKTGRRLMIGLAVLAVGSFLTTAASLWLLSPSAPMRWRGAQDTVAMAVMRHGLSRPVSETFGRTARRRSPGEVAWLRLDTGHVLARGDQRRGARRLRRALLCGEHLLPGGVFLGHLLT
jgi:hypothetical protein